MRVRNLLFPMIALVGADGADVATAQDRVAFAVDGDHRDWNLFQYDGFQDVVPDTNGAVDIRTYGSSWGSFGDEERELFTFIFRFVAPPFQGSEATTVELFFDVSQDPAFGDLTPPWADFRPEYRIGVTGRNGALTTEFHRRFTGEQWEATKEGLDIAELEAALSGRWLEGAVPWEALGSPAPTADGAPLLFRWAAKASMGQLQDFVPDDKPLDRYITSVEVESWGKIKGE